MNRITWGADIAFAVAVAVTSLAPAPAAGGETGATGGAEVTWTTLSWDDALAAAKSQGRYVFVDFYTTWCGPCKRLDKITYRDAKVVAFLDGTISVKYDAEEGVGEELADRYRVNAYPTLVVISPAGEEIDRHIGYLEPAEFLETIEGFTKGIGTRAAYEAKLKTNPDDFDTLVILGMKYADAVFPDKARATLNRAIELDPDNTHGSRNEILYALGEVSYDAGDYDEARGYFEKLLALNAEGDWHDTALKRLAYAEYKSGDAKASVETYGKYLALYPDDPAALNGFAWFCAQRGIGLDRALSAAEKAVKLSNGDPGILDTLAEVYAARGEFDRAIATAQEALAKEPDDQYFKNQVEKFKAAKAEADSQASR